MLLATRSPGKLRELRPIFAARGISVIDLADIGIAESSEEDQLEAFSTFEENALAKARFFHSLTGRPTVADDSGLAVIALGGGPGVRSKRWSGRTDLSGQALDDENNRLLLEQLSGVTDRRAHYICAAVYVDAAYEVVRRSEVHGYIIDAPRGAGGFGYDPYFVVGELKGNARTFGEVTREEKEILSHRGRAFGALLDALVEAGVLPA